MARKVLQTHEASRRTYGSPRVHEGLLQQGEVVSKKTVASVMQEIGLVAYESADLLPEPQGQLLGQ